MKLWHTIMTSLLIGIVIGLFWAAIEGDFPALLEASPIGTVPNRIEFVEKEKTFDYNATPSGYTVLYIVKIDSKEYIVNSRGGIVEHSK